MLILMTTELLVVLLIVPIIMFLSLDVKILSCIAFKIIHNKNVKIGFIYKIERVYEQKYYDENKILV